MFRVRASEHPTLVARPRIAVRTNAGTPIVSHLREALQAMINSAGCICMHCSYTYRGSAMLAGMGGVPISTIDQWAHITYFMAASRFAERVEVVPGNDQAVGGNSPTSEPILSVSHDGSTGARWSSCPADTPRTNAGLPMPDLSNRRAV